ncbi:site-specific integrase [Treponema sp. OMZ 792]|uniref:site-specific integrase n=1 Tax=unclassified Treponema TaxID=2638727 RepID=UPI0020A4806E|nr:MULTISPECIES: site-specific integrase [unclassified Treponema]UTC74124.1 site-specific integrase [Treponema sp. OMZ 792]UTC80524.1 site-specific integrase [Treponema sp. OMZ 798]
MSVKLWINRNKIYLSIYIGGKRWRESTGLTVTPNKEQNKIVMDMAEVLRSKREVSLIAVSNGLSDPELTKITVLEYVKKAAAEKNKKHPLHKVVLWIEKISPTLRMDALTPTWFENFQKTLQRETKLSPYTCENYAASLRTLFKKAVRDGVLVKDPTLGVKHIPCPESIKEFLMPEDIRKLAAEPIGGILGADVKKAFLFACCTGLRISDLKSLKWGGVSFEKKTLTKIQQKTKRAVYLPIKDEAIAFLNLLAEENPNRTDEDFIFPHVATTGTNMNQYLIEWGKRAGVRQKIGWHLARHTHATLLLESGADLYTVQKLLGHTKISTTAQYTQVTDRKKKEAIDLLPDYGIIGD